MPVYRAVFEVECLIEVSPAEKQDALEATTKMLKRIARRTSTVNSLESVTVRCRVDGRPDPANVCPNCHGRLRPTCGHCGYEPGG